MAKKQHGLGRGLGALIDDFSPTEETGGVTVLPLQKVEPNPNQPRKFFDEEELQALADSITAHGLLQPLENGAQKKGRQQEQRGGEQEDDDVGCKGSGSVCVLKKVYCKAQGKVNHRHEQCEKMRPSGGSLAQAIKAGAAAGTTPGFTGFDVLHCQSAAVGRRQGEGGSAVEANVCALPRGVRSKEEGFLAKGQGEAVGKAII